jgi:hypothetical protein
MNMNKKQQTEKREYESPVVMPLGKLPTGFGYCSGGSSYAGDCTAGISAGGYCSGGSSPAY